MKANRRVGLRQMIGQKRSQKSLENQITEISLILGTVLLCILLIANLVLFAATLFWPNWFLHSRMNFVYQEDSAPILIFILAILPLAIQQLRHQSDFAERNTLPIPVSSKIIVIFGIVIFVFGIVVPNLTLEIVSTFDVSAGNTITLDQSLQLNDWRGLFIRTSGLSISMCAILIRWIAWLRMTR